MVEVMLTGPWLDHDPIDTSEPMAVYEADHLSSVTSHSEAAGPIVDPEFSDLVIAQLDHTSTYSPDIGSQGAAMLAMNWASVLSNGIFPTYNVAYRVLGSAAHVHDFDPTAWRIARTAELRAAKAAELGTDPGNVVIDWEVSSFFGAPYGTYSDRVIRIFHDVTFRASYDRDGNDDGTIPTPPDLNLGLIPVEEPGGWDPADAEYLLESPSFAQPETWVADVLVGRAEADSYTDVLDVQTIVGSAAPFNTSFIALDDVWFEEHAWPAVGATTDYTSRGYPLRIEYDPVALSGGHRVFISAAFVWMESVWTPPRYRYRIFMERTGIPPRRIGQRSDGLTGGARRVLGGGNTRQSGSRTLGSIL